MKRLLFLLVAGLAVAASAREGNPARHDRQQLQGAWELVTVEASVGHVSSLSMKDLADARLVVRGDVCRYKLGKSNLKMTYRLDLGKNPKTIDLTITAGPARGRTFRAIYALERGTLKICHHQRPGNERPTEFFLGPDSEFIIVVWKRQSAPSAAEGS
jgi:uncharacterized protein (TIGR03067 family)